MRSGATPSKARSATAVVAVDGAVRAVDSVRTRRSLGGGGVPGVSDAAAADGSCVWTRDQAVLPAGAVRPSPWRRMSNWPPVRRAAIAVAMGTVEAGVYSAGSFVVDTTSSSNGQPVASTFIDPIDRLRKNVTIPPMMNSMPPAAEGDPLLNVGLSSDYIVDRILRACSIFSTPYLPAANDGVSVPGQGSMWPARGTCTAAGAASNLGLSANFATANWGWGITDADCYYTPTGTITAAGGLDISCMVSSGNAAASSINVYLTGRSERYQLVIGSTRSVTLNYWDGAAYTAVLSLAAATGWTRVSARVSASSAVLTTDDGRSVTGTYSTVSAVTSAAVSSVRILANNGAVIGGVMVSNLTAGAYIGQTLNGVLYAGTSLNPKLIASPSLIDVNARDTIADIANATCRTWWWTEDGVFQWIPGDRLLARTTATTFTSLDNLESVGWEDALSDVFSKVVVEYESPAVSRSGVTGAEVWRGGSQTVNGVAYQFITAPDDEDWFYLGTPQQLLTSTVADFNAGPGSWFGAITNGTTSGGTLVSDSSLNVFLTNVNPKTWKLTTAATAVYDQKVPDLSTIKKWKQGEDLPVLRARAKTTWAASSQSFGSGPSDAPEYRHSGGRWLQGYADEAVPAIGDFLQTWLCSPHPRITGLQLVHDARAQVGDVVDIEDSTEFGMRWTVLLTSIDQSVDGAKGAMSVDCFVISAVSLGTTYGELDEANAGKTYGQLDAANSGRTYGQFDAAPINA